MLSWYIITSSAFNTAKTASQLSDDALYFLSDTKEIYKGSTPFTEAVYLYEDTAPESPAVGKIYINKTTLEGKVYTGTAWVTIIQPVQTSVVATNTDKPVSGKAVADYVKTAIEAATGAGDIVAKVEWDDETATLQITMTGEEEPEELQLTGLAVDLQYNKSTGKLDVVDAEGEVIGTGVNLDLERFISASAYDHANKEIILAFNDAAVIDIAIATGSATTALPTESVANGTIKRMSADGTTTGATWYKYTAGQDSAPGTWAAVTEAPLVINVGALVDTYTAQNSETIKLSVTDNAFKAEAIISTAPGNQLTKTEQGLFVAAYDDSDVMKLVENATNGNIAGLSSAGQVKDLGVTPGQGTLAETPSATVLATEAAVAAVRSALQSAIDGKMNKVTSGKAGEVLTATADGNAQTSGVKIGSDTLADDPDSTTLATEAAVEAYVADKAVLKTNVSTSAPASAAAASDTKVMSEKLVATMLEWKTSV